MKLESGMGLNLQRSSLVYVLSCYKTKDSWLFTCNCVHRVSPLCSYLSFSLIRAFVSFPNLQPKIRVKKTRMGRLNAERLDQNEANCQESMNINSF